MAADQPTVEAVRHRLRRMDNALGRHGVKPGKQQAWEEYLSETLRLFKLAGEEARFGERRPTRKEEPTTL